MTEEQFDFMHPMNVDSDGNVISNDAGIAAAPSQLSFSPGDLVSAAAETTLEVDASTIQPEAAAGLLPVLSGSTDSLDSPAPARLEEFLPVLVVSRASE
jgi:hypothetical protein